jgi:hypothetical protein
MLGKYTKGMNVKIPARFQDNNKNFVDVDNVVVTIEYFDRDRNEVIRVVEGSPMNKVSMGNYFYDFCVPPHVSFGNYVAKISAKQAGSKSIVLEGFTNFEVVPEIIKEAMVEAQEQELKKPAADDRFALIPKSQIAAPNPFSKTEIEDVVVDVYNNPVPGVHVHAYIKKDFTPKSIDNVKVGSAMTDKNGTWKMQILPGEYIFVYKGITFKELREIRRI